jgi:hypothetical protein
MSYYGRLFKAMLWSHSRNINVEVFPNIVRFSIPLYSDGATARVLSAKVEHSSLVVIVKRAPEPPKPIVDIETPIKRQQLI